MNGTLRAGRPPDKGPGKNIDRRGQFEKYIDFSAMRKSHPLLQTINLGCSTKTHVGKTEKEVCADIARCIGIW
jgi:hypothetical protein